MPSMSDDKIEFEWGKARGRGGAKKDVQFYESFEYDESKYSLYDSVYLCKDGVAEPYIGKITKIWESPNKSRKVKILWFFRPSEISSYIGGLRILENELFLATGAGSGLENVNSLESIAGKCNVVCISKDKRNRPPLPEELSMADFVFYRTFNVDKFTISDKLGESISNVKVDLLLNNENPQIKNPIGIEPNDKGHGINAVAAPEIEMVLQKRDTCKIPLLVGDVPVERKLDAGHLLDKKKHSPNEGDIEPSEKDNVCDGKMAGFKCKESSRTDHLNLKAGAKYMKEDNAVFRDHGVKSSLSTSGANDHRSLDDRPSKKHKADDSTHSSSKLRPVNELLDERPHKKLKSSEALGVRAKSNPPNLISKKDTRVYGQVSLVTRRPDADSSKWFTGLPWKDSMKAAQEDGTLVLLQNLDPIYTSSEVEDIVWHSFRQNCTAKVLNCAAISSPHSTGQAFVIFRTKEAAVNVVRELEERCLMLPNGRPLIGHVAAGHLRGKSSSFPGHLYIDRLKFSMQKDKRDAVSTSHSSQPNTLEYDMAMEWRLLQERSELMRKNLLRKQGEEVKKLKENLKRIF